MADKLERVVMLRRDVLHHADRTSTTYKEGRGYSVTPEIAERLRARGSVAQVRGSRAGAIGGGAGAKSVRGSETSEGGESL